MRFLPIIKNKLSWCSSLILLGCTTSAVLPEDVVLCHHKYDDNVIIQYEQKNIIKTSVRGVTMFYILSIDKEEIFLSLNEIENYKCVNGEMINESNN